MNSAYKRLQVEYRRSMKDPIPYLTAQPLPSNFLEWRYVIRGPNKTPYDGGIYYGKIVFPHEYPFKPPSKSPLTSIKTDSIWFCRFGKAFTCSRRTDGSRRTRVSVWRSLLIILIRGIRLGSIERNCFSMFDCHFCLGRSLRSSTVSWVLCVTRRRHTAA